jgi:hypothetical protein
MLNESVGYATNLPSSVTSELISFASTLLGRLFSLKFSAQVGLRPRVTPVVGQQAPQSFIQRYSFVSQLTASFILQVMVTHVFCIYCKIEGCSAIGVYCFMEATKNAHYV